MIKALLKFTFAGAIIYWLFQRGQIDFSLVTKSFQYKFEWFLCLSFIAMNAILTAVRWKFLLQIKSDIKFTFLSILRINWIGLFFNSFLPGAVTGDFIKLVYAKKLDKNFSKTFLVTSVLIDRIIGLMGLLFLLGVFSLIYYTELLVKVPQVIHLIHFNFLLFIGVLTLISSLFLPVNVQNVILDVVQKVPLLGDKLRKFFEQIWLIGTARQVVLSCLALSTFTQLFNVMAFWVIASPFFETHIPLQYVFTFIPIGFLTVAVPITPSGLGVGHAIFGALFAFYGTKNGASLFNLYFLGFTCINLLGVFPYLLSGKRRSEVLQEASQIE